MSPSTADGHRYGGSWSDRKVQLVAKYAQAYRRVLKNQEFRTWYLDIFAGSGTRVSTTTTGLAITDQEHQQITVTPGSVKAMLNLTEPFHRYVFVENDEENHRALTALVQAHPLAPRCSIDKGDAISLTIANLKSRTWLPGDRDRGLIFVDPYATFDFSLMRALAATKRLDVVVLFAVNAVQRVIGAMRTQPGQAQALTRLFGDEDWKVALRGGHGQARQETLFDDGTAAERGAYTTDAMRIHQHYQDKVKAVFGHVAPAHSEIHDDNNLLRFTLMLAVANPSPNARAAADRIARSVFRTRC